MMTTIQKWGNSLALRLPKALASEARMAEGSRVELVRTDEGVLVKAGRKPHYRLSELLAGVTKRNAHPETAWGRSVGRERLEWKGVGSLDWRVSAGHGSERLAG